jgi:site-specific recombinase
MGQIWPNPIDEITAYHAYRRPKNRRIVILVMLDIAKKRIKERSVLYLVSQVAMEIRNVKHRKAHTGRRCCWIILLRL